MKEEFAKWRNQNRGNINLEYNIQGRGFRNQAGSKLVGKEIFQEFRPP